MMSSWCHQMRMNGKVNQGPLFDIRSLKTMLHPMIVRQYSHLSNKFCLSQSFGSLRTCRQKMKQTCHSLMGGGVLGKSTLRLIIKPIKSLHCYSSLFFSFFFFSFLTFSPLVECSLPLWCHFVNLFMFLLYKESMSVNSIHNSIFNNLHGSLFTCCHGDSWHVSIATCSVQWGSV